MSTSMRAVATTAAVAMLSTGVLVATGTSASAAPKAPQNITPTGDIASNTPLFTWQRPSKSVEFEVQVDNNTNFGSPEVTERTVNNAFAPTKLLSSGDQYVRVRAFDAKGTPSPWAQSSFYITDFAPPTPESPAPDEVLEQPDDPPLLSWETVPGATSYVVEVDRDDDFIGAERFTTETTALVYPKALTALDAPYYWRVKAIKASGIESDFSAPARFQVSPLPDPVLNPGPANVTDVVMDWEPVPGAKWYQLRVALDQDFNTIIDEQAKVLGTRYSPRTTYDNNQYFWQVRPVDLNGATPAWSTTSFENFRRSWPDVPELVHPAHDASTSSGLYLQWEPVPHATQYQIQFSSEPNFSTSVLCETASTTYTPFAYTVNETTGAMGGRERCRPTEEGQTYYWRVRALDLPFRNPGVEGIYSETRSFTWHSPNSGDVTATTPPAVTTQAIALTGSGFGSGQQCAGTIPVRCAVDVPATPVFSWDPVPGANEYRIYVAEDDDFTQLLESTSKIAATTDTLWAPSLTNGTHSFPDSEAGGSYHWFVRACARANRSIACGPSPISVRDSATGQFRKVSPAVDVDPHVATDVSEATFNWTDYHATNADTSWLGAQSQQTAKSYRIQVADNPSFTRPLTNATVDQTTYTAPDQLYPEGTLYWRVQAIDAKNNSLTWSPVQTFRKSTPAVVLTSPRRDGTVSGLEAFRWEAQPFAESYDIEVYANNDTAFSRVNRVFSANVSQSAYTWDRQIPVSSEPYVWRVRRTDGSRNKGAWSEIGRFRVEANAPVLAMPVNRADVKANGALFTWSGVPNASSYEVQIRNTTATRNWKTVTTAATAWASDRAVPDGTYQWRVTAKNSRRATIDTSPWSTFSVDGTAPTVKTVTPRYSAKRKSKFKATFSEKVRGVTKKTMTLRMQGKKKKIKAKVKYKGLKATLIPKKKLKKGKTYTVTLTPKIKDLKGHKLMSYSWTVRVR